MARKSKAGCVGLCVFPAFLHLSRWCFSPRLKSINMTSKTIDYYLSLPYTIVVVPDKDDGGYVAWVRELKGCMTQAETWQELKFMIEDEKQLWLEVAIEQGDTIPEPKVKL